MNALFTVAILRLVQDGVAPLHIGLVETAAGAAGILGAVVAPWLIERLPTGWLTIAVSWSPLPLVVPMALWANAAVVAAALGCVLLVNPAGNAGMSAYRISVTPDHLVGTGPVGDPVRGDGVAAAGPAARRCAAQPPRWPQALLVAGRAVRAGRDHPDDGRADPVGAEAGAVADVGTRRTRSTKAPTAAGMPAELAELAELAA